MILPLVRVPAFLALLFVYIFISIAGDLLIRDLHKKLRFFSMITSYGSRLGLKIFGIHVSTIGFDPIFKKQHQLIVSNHVSYLDILIISSIMPSLFITSVEVQKTFFLGFMSKLGGSFFVERRSKSKLLEEIERIAAVLKNGFTITLFPEGTSSNGEKVLPFKAALFTVAEKGNTDILPVCIKYTSIENKPLTESNRDLAFYYGDIRFFPHLLRLFTVKRIDVRVSFLKRMSAEGNGRKEIVEKCYQTINSAFV